MVDVRKVALDRRARLQEEIRKLDEFVKIAEALIKTCASGKALPETLAPLDTPSDANEEPMMLGEHYQLSDSKPIEVQRPAITRRGLYQ